MSWDRSAGLLCLFICAWQRAKAGCSLLSLLAVRSLKFFFSLGFDCLLSPGPCVWEASVLASVWGGRSVRDLRLYMPAHIGPELSWGWCQRLKALRSLAQCSAASSQHPQWRRGRLGRDGGTLRGLPLCRLRSLKGQVYVALVASLHRVQCWQLSTLASLLRLFCFFGIAIWWLIEAFLTWIPSSRSPPCHCHLMPLLWHVVMVIAFQFSSCLSCFGGRDMWDLTCLFFCFGFILLCFVCLFGWGCGACMLLFSLCPFRVYAGLKSHPSILGFVLSVFLTSLPLSSSQSCLCPHTWPLSLTVVSLHFSFGTFAGRFGFGFWAPSGHISDFGIWSTHPPQIWDFALESA